MDRVEGLAEAEQMFTLAPDAARDQVAVELGLIGRDLLALQQAMVPKDTGDLERGLSLAVSIEQLRVRVGLLGLKNRRSGKMNFGDLFYGIIVDKGRAAQTVMVERRRKVRGRLRLLNGRKHPDDIVATYPMRVKAFEGVPYIELNDGDVDAVATQRLASFWDAVMGRMGAGA